MGEKARRTDNGPMPPRCYRGADVPMSAIRKFARQVGDRFRPNKIILFGSYAYGIPTAASDVDILVIMPTRNEIDQRFKIRWAVPRPFAMDLLVRTPADIARRLADGDLFHTEIMTKGKVLYEAGDTRVGGKGRRRLQGRLRTAPKSRRAS